MRKGIVKIVALLVLGAATLTSCSIENRGRHGRYDRDRYYDNRGHDRDHHYDNGRW